MSLIHRDWELEKRTQFAGKRTSRRRCGESIWNNMDFRVVYQRVKHSEHDKLSEELSLKITTEGFTI